MKFTYKKGGVNFNKDYGEIKSLTSGGRRILASYVIENNIFKITDSDHYNGKEIEVEFFEKEASALVRYISKETETARKKYSDLAIRFSEKTTPENQREVIEQKGFLNCLEKIRTDIFWKNILGEQNDLLDNKTATL